MQAPDRKDVFFPPASRARKIGYLPKKVADYPKGQLSVLAAEIPLWYYCICRRFLLTNLFSSEESATQ